MTTIPAKPGTAADANRKKARVSRQDWVLAAIDTIAENGIGGIKVVVLAKKMDITSGSFYWHFNKLRDLLDAVLDHWEHHLTDHIIQDARRFEGPADQRIHNLMKQVIGEGASECDHAISIWARTDKAARETYNRTLEQRFEFAAWMFSEAGFSPEDARVRGRLTVAYLMGEATTSLRHQDDWEDVIEAQFNAIIGRQQSGG